MKKRKTYEYERPSIELVEANFSDELLNTEEVVIQIANDHGERNQPEKNDPATLYMSQITDACNQIARECIYAPLQPDHNRRLFEKVQAQTKDNLKVQIEEQKALEHKHKNVKRQKEQNEKGCKKAIYKDNRYKALFILQLLLFGGDTFLSSSALMMMGFNLITSYLLGICIALCSMFIADNLPSIWTSKKMRKGKRILFVSALVGFLAIIFGVLGKYRSLSLEGMFEGSWLYFLLLNLLFISVVSIISWKFKPNADEKRLIDMWKNLKAKLSGLQKELKKVQSKIDYEQNLQEKSQDNYDAHRSIGVSLEQRLITAYRRFINLYFQENKFSRRDGITPEFFHKYKAPKLKLHFMNHQKTKRDESTQVQFTEYRSANGVV